MYMLYIYIYIFIYIYIYIYIYVYIYLYIYLTLYILSFHHSPDIDGGRAEQFCKISVRLEVRDFTM